jgi:hypothetical protein
MLKKSEIRYLIRKYGLGNVTVRQSIHRSTETMSEEEEEEEGGGEEESYK